MYIRVNLVVMSHLSDIQANPNNESNNTKINFVKFLLSRYPNTCDKIDADIEFEAFSKKYPKLVG